jgi:outer membrane lipoprotein
MIKKQITGLLALLLLTACTHVISHNARNDADETIPFQELANNPGKYNAKSVILGGRIIRSHSSSVETLLEVLQQPLDWRYEPEDSDVSYGRFMVRFEDYRDPEIYKKGRRITVAGKIAGGKVMLLDKLKYTYPVIIPAEIHLWRDESTSSPRFHFGIGIGGVIK